VISIIVAPDPAQQVYRSAIPLCPAPRVDDADLRIIEAIRDVRQAKVWSILNMISDDPGLDRAAGRQTRRALWERVKRLKGLGLIFGRGRNELAVTRSQRAPTRRRTQRRKGTVSKSTVFSAVSADNLQPATAKPEFQQPVGFQRFRKTPASYLPSVGAEETETAPDPALVAQAARSLASLPRRPRRRWSGLIGRVRSYRNMPIQLPDGRVVYALGARRGRVAYTSQPDGPIGSLDGVGRDWGVIRADLVAVVKNPMALILGARKRGVCEVPTAAKAAACRVNGCRPVHAGRRRGRPRNA